MPLCPECSNYECWGLVAVEIKGLLYTDYYCRMVTPSGLDEFHPDTTHNP